MARFASVVFDVDSTLTAVEGIEWLADLKGASVADRVRAMTSRAMEGASDFARIYRDRLDMVRPTRSDIAALSTEYERHLMPGASATIHSLQDGGVHVLMISGGLREAIVPLAVHLGVAAGDLHAVGISFAPDGSYASYDATSPLARSNGKATVVRSLDLRRPILAVGDGNTDLEVRPAVDAFAAFTGVARRPQVVAGADHVVSTMKEVLDLVL